MALMRRFFEDVYKDPERCGHKAQNCLRKKKMKDIIANVCKTLIDI